MARVPRSRLRLEHDESVLYAERGHVVSLARAGTFALAVVALCIVGFLDWRQAPPWFGLVLAAALGISVTRLGLKVLRYRSSLVVVTDLRVLQREGLFRRVGREVPVAKIDDVRYRQSVTGRLFDFGDVQVRSSSPGDAPMLRRVRDPERLQHAIHQAVVRHDRRAVPNAASVPMPQVQGFGFARGPSGPPSPHGALAGKLELLEALRQGGYVSETEFSEKRAELLGEGD